jgi:hypothetical protein
MRLVSGIGLAMLLAGTVVVGILDDIRPASAQGGIVCSYGTSQYRRCCRESYRNNPSLGPSSRARDIDACMSGNTREEKEKPDSRPTRADRGSSSRIRRIDCSADGCQEGCAADEVAISAFCGPTALPATNGDRDVQCLGQGNPERPTVLVCAKQ